MDPLEAIGGGAGIAAVAAAVGAVVQRWLSTRSADRRARLDHDGLVSPSLLTRIAALEAQDEHCTQQIADLTGRVERAEERTEDCERRHTAQEERAALAEMREAELRREVEEIARLARRGTLPPASSDRTTVLVVDDDETTRASLCRLAESLGYHAIPASSADEARALVAATRVDVLLADWHLGAGEADGRDLIASVRSRPRAHRIATLLVTGDPHGVPPGERARVLGKPVDGERLRAAIEGALEDTGQHALPGRG